MYELLDQHLMFESTILDEFPNLKVTIHKFVGTVGKTFVHFIFTECVNWFDVVFDLVKFVILIFNV